MSTTSAQQHAAASTGDCALKISYSHLADSEATHEIYYLHRPGTATGYDYSDAANKPIESAVKPTG